MLSESSLHLAGVLDTKLLQSEALLFEDGDLALGPFLQSLNCALWEDVEDVEGIMSKYVKSQIKL